MIFGKATSQIFHWYKFFREVCGYFEDKHLIQMGGPGKTVEGDGMFVLAQRKGGVGRWHTKEHVYVCTERKARKIRRIVVRNKTAKALEVFDRYILPGTRLMCDEGGENAYFKKNPNIESIFEVPGPIHVNLACRLRKTLTMLSLFFFGYCLYTVYFILNTPPN